MRSTATQMWVRLIGVGLRRVVVTPTFAAGLGVVIAAVIAYPLTRTVISYGPEPPAAGHACLTAGCATTAPDGGGLASAKPGTRLAAPARPRHQATPAQRPASRPLPVMTYQTLRQWQGGFAGLVTITPPPGPVPARWRLRLSYRSATISSVWGGSWTARGPHVVLVTVPGQGGPGSVGGGPGGKTGIIRVYLAVTGAPGPPTGCELNGRPCAPSRVLGVVAQPSSGQTAEPTAPPRA